MQRQRREQRAAHQQECIVVHRGVQVRVQQIVGETKATAPRTVEPGDQLERACRQPAARAVRIVREENPNPCRDRPNRDLATTYSKDTPRDVNHAEAALSQPRREARESISERPAIFVADRAAKRREFNLGAADRICRGHFPSAS